MTRDLQRYVFLLTGRVCPIAPEPPGDGPLVLVGSVARGSYSDTLDEQEILARTVERDGRVALLLAGGSPAATQWAVYAFLERLGCGFYLGGDALPAPQPDLYVADLDLRRTPTFAVRGTLPWYNFLNGPTTWNPADHRRFYDQLAKQGANFVGYHSYDWEPWAAYLRGFTGVEMGEVLATSGANHYRDLWGPVPTATADYAFGTDRLYAHGLFGAECAFGYATYADGVRQQQAMLSESLGYARARGIRTCLGFEVAGDPTAEENVRILRARLEQVVRTYPLDYVWLWQAEGRGGGIDMRAWDVVEAAADEIAPHFSYLGDAWRVAEGARICRYIQLGHRILRELAPDVRLIVSGWGGDRWMAFTDFYRGLDATLPNDIIFAALDNIDPTFEPNVSTVYGELKPSRERWPIPWFESDGGGTRHDQWGPQPNVNAFAPLLDDAQGKGCQGILGIHWRTRAVEEVAGFTFRRAWEPDLTPAAYFARFARACYGPSTAAEMAAVHQRLEELGPRWTGAKGQVECGPFTWFDQEGHGLPPAGEWPPYRAGHLPAPERFSELDALEERLTALHARLRDGGAADGGQDTLARLTYLRSTLRWVISYDRAALHLWHNGPVEAALQRGEAAQMAGDTATALTSGHEALALLAACGLGAAVQGLADNVTNQGELGVLAAINGKAVAAYKRLIARAEALVGERHRHAPALLAANGWPDTPRLWVWSPGDVAATGRPLVIEARALGPQPTRAVRIHYRPLGEGSGDGWKMAPCTQEQRAVYRGEIPADYLTPAGLQYYVASEDAHGTLITAPHDAPHTTFSATVVGTDPADRHTTDPSDELARTIDRRGREGQAAGVARTAGTAKTGG